MAWKSRATLWTSMVVSLVVIWFCYLLYNMVVEITFSKSGKGGELIRFGTTLIETHYTGLKVEKSGLSSATISPWLTEEATLKLYKQINDTHRLDYLKKNGVMVYGAVVTGPVRELEKLRQNPLFHDFELGRIEVWNW